MRAEYDILAVEVPAHGVLRLTFADGTHGDLDVGDDLWGEIFEPLNDPKFFALVTVDPESRTVVWPNGADMAPDGLYAELRRVLATS